MMSLGCCSTALTRATYKSNSLLILPGSWREAICRHSTPSAQIRTIRAIRDPPRRCCQDEAPAGRQRAMPDGGGSSLEYDSSSDHGHVDARIADLLRRDAR